MGCAPIVTLAEPEAVAPLVSVTLKLSVKTPFTGCVTLLVPIPVYGVVPPVAETVQLKGLPAVRPDVGQVTVTTRGWAAIVTLAEPDAVTVLASVTLNDSVKVPLAGCVTLWPPVPVYGEVPPEAETLHEKGLPAVKPDEGQVTVTTSG